jgi:hypothetical protein
VSVGLGWLGVGVGAVGCVALYLMAGGSARPSGQEDVGSDRKSAWLCAAATLALTIIAWAIAMQRREPYSTGQGLALGFLIGGVTGAVAILLSFRLSQIAGGASTRAKRLASLSNVFYALFAVSLVYSLFTGNPWEPLIGFAMGAAMAAILHTYVPSSSLDELRMPRMMPVRTETWALFAITIAAAVLLSVKHFDSTQLRMWWPLPILVATTALVANYVAIELGSLGKLRENAGRSYLVSLLISAVLIIGLSALYSWRIVHTWQLLEVVAVGLGIGTVIAWLAASISSGSGGSEAGAVCVLLVAAFVTVAFKLWSGLGVAIGLIAAWSIAIPALGESAEDREGNPLGLIPEALGWTLYLGLMVLLFRLFVGQYAHELRGTDLQVHYTFIGAMLGAVLPFMFAGSITRLRDARAPLLGIALMGLAAAASPLLLFVLWQAKAVMGFSFGLTAAAAFMMLARLSDGDKRYSIGLLAVGAQLVAIQFVGPLLQMELTRAVRIYVLAGAVMLGVVWLALSSLFAARRAR